MHKNVNKAKLCGFSSVSRVSRVKLGLGFAFLRFFSHNRPWVATCYWRDQSVVRWSWSSWNVSHSGTNEWMDETSQMPAGHSSQQWYQDRSTCKDWFEGQDTQELIRRRDSERELFYETSSMYRPAPTPI